MLGWRTARSADGARRRERERAPQTHLHRIKRVPVVPSADIAEQCRGRDARLWSNNRREPSATNYARALYEDPGATLADLREAVTTLEDTERSARRTLGGAHPLAAGLSGHFLRKARAALRARETPSGEA